METVPVCISLYRYTSSPSKEAENEKPDGPNESIGLEFFKPWRHRPYANAGNQGPWRVGTSPAEAEPSL